MPLLFSLLFLFAWEHFWALMVLELSLGLHLACPQALLFYYLATSEVSFLLFVRLPPLCISPRLLTVLFLEIWSLHPFSEQIPDSGGVSLLLSLFVLSYPLTEIRGPWFVTLILLVSHRKLPWSFSALHQRCRHQYRYHRICLYFRELVLDFCSGTWQKWQILRATVSLPIATTIAWASKVDSVD